MTIVLSGTPRSTNSLYRSVCRGNRPCVYMTTEGKALKESYAWEAKSQWKKRPLKLDIEVNVDLYFDTKRVHDIDNYAKILYDSLTGIVWEDDGQIQKATVTKHIDKQKPRIEIDVTLC